MFIGEQFENETKEEYIKKGYDWNKVIIYSNLAAILSGLVSSIAIWNSKTPINYITYFLVFATSVTAYVSIQSLMTDLRILLINRKILRVAYISIYVISIINIILSDIYRYNWTGLLLFTILLILIFITSSIGASDVRLLAVGIPFAISIEGYTAILLLIISLLLVALGMFIKRAIYVIKETPKRREQYPEMLEELGTKQFDKISRRAIAMELRTSEEHAVPVGPFMIMPFLAYLLAYPFFL